MKFIFDIFLLLIIILVSTVSAKRGFVRSVWSTVAIIGSFTVAYVFGAAVGEYICKDYILKIVTDYTFEIIESLISAPEGNYNLTELFSTLPEEFALLAESCGADLGILSDRFLSSVAMSEEHVYELASSIAEPISRTISHAVGILCSFLLSLVVFAIIGFAVRIIAKLPIVKTLDGVLGLAFGFLKGIIIVCMLCVVAAIFIESEFMNGNVGVYFRALTENSYIFRLFCAYSPIDFINVG